MKKLFIFILLLFGMISMSFAALTDNNTAYWTLDNTLVDATGNGYTLTNNGANFITGKINEGLNLNFAEADYLETGVSNIGSSSYTLNIWAIADDTTHQKIMSKDLASGSNREFQMNFDSNSFQFIMWVETGTVYSYDYLMTHSTFQMISIVVNDSANNFKMYVNGALVHTEPISTTSSPRFNTAAPLYIGNAVSTYFDGKIDEPSIWGRALSDSEILELYNSGNGSQYPYAPPAPAQSIEFTNISLVNNSIYNSNFTIQINLTNTSTNANINTSYSLIQNYSIPTREGYKLNYINLATRTSTANQFCIEKGYDYGQNIYGTTIASEQMYLYLTSTWSLAFSTEYITSFECVKNVTFGINTLMPNATININSFDEGNHSIYFYAANNETNATSNIYYFFTDITNPIINQIANISNGSFAVNFSTIINVTELNPSTCYINITELENVTTPDNFYINCTDTQVFTSAGLHNAFVIATDLAGNTGTYSYNFTIIPFVYVNFTNNHTSLLIEDYTATIYHPDGRTTVPTINNNSQILLSPVNNGELDLGIHTIQFTKAGYIITNFSVNINETSGNTNYTFQVNPVTIFMRAFDANTLQQIIFNVTISDGTIVTFNNIMNLSKMYSEVPNGDITIKVNSEGYSQAIFSNTLEDYTSLTFDVYLTPSGSSTAVTFNVKDFYSNLPLENVLVEAKRIINDRKVTVQQTLTSSNGITYMNLDITKDYEFIFTKAGYAMANVNSIPTTTTYTIKLKPDVSTYEYIDGINFKISPKESIIFAPDNINFTAFISGSGISISSISITDQDNNLLFSDSSTEPTGTTFSFYKEFLNTTNITHVNILLTYVVNGNTKEYYKTYDVLLLNDNEIVSFINLGKDKTEETQLFKFFVMITIFAAVIIGFRRLDGLKDYVSGILILPTIIFIFIEWISPLYGTILILALMLLTMGANKR